MGTCVSACARLQYRSLCCFLAPPSPFAPHNLHVPVVSESQLPILQADAAKTVAGIRESMKRQNMEPDAEIYSSMLTTFALAKDSDRAVALMQVHSCFLLAGGCPLLLSSQTACQVSAFV